MAKCMAILGWSLPAIESMKKTGKPYVVVSFSDFEGYAKEHDIPFVAWDFNSWNEVDSALKLRENLNSFDVDVAIPMFEETVEWAGALNSIYRDDPRVLNRAFLLRNKAIMKRKALLSGLRVGLFEQVHNREEVHAFMERLNQAEVRLPGEPDAWVHLKPFSAAGTVGHKLLRSPQDINEKVIDKDFPCLVESHLPGREFSCEAFIHKGKIKFMNITEYVTLGFSNFVPPTPELAEKRPIIKKAMQKLVDSFGIEYGMIHPEWFLTDANELNFGEVAGRIPGGHMFELMQKVYDFDPYQAFFLCSDPDTTDEELKAVFPKRNFKPSSSAGVLLVYPSPGYITKLQVPEELEEDPYFESHNLQPPIPHKVLPDRDGFGNHYGTVWFHGEDPSRMRERLLHYKEAEFYA